MPSGTDFGRRPKPNPLLRRFEAAISDIQSKLDLAVSNLEKVAAIREVIRKLLED